MRLISLFVLFFSFPGFANELILSRTELTQRGYQIVTENKLEKKKATRFSLLPKGQLAWPVTFYDQQHSIGNNMNQFQDYGSGSYFHGGCDLRAQAGEWVMTPVTGTLNAGHYAYTTNNDGSLTKAIKPWPETGDETYFEVSVTTADGFHFEFHHINRSTLPADILRALDKGKVTVTAGTRLGQVISWPIQGPDGTYYHHTHYNIHTPDGQNLNPEYYSVALPDHKAPEVSDIFALDPQGVVNGFSGGPAPSGTSEFVVAATDHLGDDVYVHPPTLLRLAFASGVESKWDFRERLQLPNGTFPNIWDVFMDQINSPNGGLLQTQGNYNANTFLFRLKVPPGAKGPFQIEVGDEAGQSVVTQGSLN